MCVSKVIDFKLFKHDLIISNYPTPLLVAGIFRRPCVCVCVVCVRAFKAIKKKKRKDNTNFTAKPVKIPFAKRPLLCNIDIAPLNDLLLQV